MPYAHPSCQLAHSTPGDSRLISPPEDGTQCPETTLVRGTARQSIDHTASRRSGPRKWLRSVQWLIGAGLHVRANATTLRIAEDLAARMDYDTGHVLYGLRDMVDRLDISRSQICKHISYLRELGALAWVQHGSRTNRLAAMGLKGWSGTATEYAAVIPAAYDHAMGHTVIGSGYTARIIVDLRKRPGSPVDTGSNTPVDNSSPEARETPSLWVVKEEGQVQLVGGFNYTSRASRESESPTRPSKKNRSSSGTGRHALQVAQDIRIARQVRPLVTWTQREGLRRLAFALRPLIDAGMDAYGIAAYLNSLCSGLRWRPKAPANYIRTVLADQEQRAHKQAAAQARYEVENAPVGAFQATTGQWVDFMTAHQQGLDRYRHDIRTRGLDDLSRGETAAWDAEADMAAFLAGSPA